MIIPHDTGKQLQEADVLPAGRKLELPAGSAAGHGAGGDPAAGQPPAGSGLGAVHRIH